MKKIIVASKNPVKVRAAQEAFERMFPEEVFESEGVSAVSGVSDQPFSDEETYTGALNRIKDIRQRIPDADYWVSFEGGVEDKNNEIEAFAWVLIENKDGVVGKGRSATFFLPPAVSQLMREGMELGDADDKVFGLTNSKEINGTIGSLTGNLVTRTSYYVDAAVLALIPFKNSTLYRPET
ncbi:inosine/xanthosine triphosphatase [Patescibacteria group bacterium]|nr:inosine/xanthosine triphosphatase [Patescibacteria group bacterium]MBU1500756.1 inosine/xanthosine triphosphatase [Patescibacteria group bacterium]MBU2080811.1 inosine/xanthosine triphosphatase [Patescibacteria group bacterium]MBU2123916.1 inosine/xanthosine triphosphatase [Patescibacteria group bacterium]MBU2194793.1 inosine/xanthosine triphosphatase [Patescibacteria group bacterium]